MKQISLFLIVICGASLGRLLSANPLPEPTQTLTSELVAKITDLVDADGERLVALFKDLHQHPELAYTEIRTAGIVAKELKKLGIEVTEGIGKTGVVGVLKNGSGPTVWFRADMDCNSVKEATGLPYAAVGKQKLPDGSEADAMHACGHDAHVTWLLGLAKTMVALKSEWSGTLVLCFQPAEEVGTGAKTMVAEGLWEKGFPKPDFALGSHTAPGPTGYVVAAPGVRMAGVDQLDVTFFGVGGHGSTPEVTIDPVVMAAQAVLSYQTIISRNVDPQEAAVLTVGSIEAGRDNNVIPASAILKLNLRWFSPAVRERMVKRIGEISQGVAIAAGVSTDKMPKITMKGNSGPLVNDKELTARLTPSLEALVGKGKVVSGFPSVMGSEDFPDLFDTLKGVPYTFMLIGVAPPEVYAKAKAEGKPVPYSNHNPDFFVDLNAIPLGAKVNAVAAFALLQNAK